MFFDEPESVAVRQLGSIFADFQLSARKKESSMVCIFHWRLFENNKSLNELLGNFSRLS